MSWMHTTAADPPGPCDHVDRWVRNEDTNKLERRVCAGLVDHPQDRSRALVFLVGNPALQHAAATRWLAMEGFAAKPQMRGFRIRFCSNVTPPAHVTAR